MKYIAGVGNYSMYDDSIGIKVVEYIEEKNLDKGFKALDLSANILNLVSYFEEKTELILIVDTGKLGLNPGDYMFFRPEEAQTVKVTGNISTHEGDLLKVIELADATGSYIPEILIMGIEPESVKEEFGLSEVLQERLGEYAEAAIKELWK